MGKIEYIVNVIDDIPKILQYFVPGVVFIVIIRTFSLKNFARNYTIIFSCVISYLFISLVGTVNSLTINRDVFREPIVVSGISILLALVTGVSVALLFNSEYFKEYTLKYFHKTLYDDIWQDVFDFKNGTNLKIYIKDRNYYIIGHYKFNEEKEENSWIALSAYSMYSKEQNELIEPSYSDNENVLITLRMKDIEHIEVF